MGNKLRVNTGKIEAQSKKPVTRARGQRNQFLESQNPLVHQVLKLQQTLGNQEVQRLIKSGTLQAKLKIGKPNDIYEKEADRIADRVMVMPGGSLGRKEDEPVPPKLCQNKTPEITTNTESIVNPLKSVGKTMPESTHVIFESPFGADFRHVRVPTDLKAVKIVNTFNAKAFKMGGDIGFGAGHYMSETNSGKELILNESSCIIQQNTSGSKLGIQRKVSERFVACRNTRKEAASTLKKAESAAIKLAEGAAREISMYYTSYSRIKHSNKFRRFRTMLWKRFHLDFNRTQIRNTLCNKLLSRYINVASWIKRFDQWYLCGPLGVQPPECSKNSGIAVVPPKKDRIVLCDDFWGFDPESKAMIILHEWFHFVYGEIGDEKKKNLDNAHCYHSFAADIAGKASIDNLCPSPRKLLPERRSRMKRRR